MSEKIDTKTLYHIFDDITHNFMVITEKVGKKGTNGARISKSNRILCLKLLQQYYISSCAVEFLNGTGSGGIVVDTTILWIALGIIAGAALLILASLACYSFNRLAHHTSHHHVAKFFKWLGIIFCFVVAVVIILLTNSGRDHRYHYRWQ